MANRFLIKHADGRVEGPFTSSELRDAAREGRITRDTRVQQEGMSSWHKADRIPKLAAAFAEFAPTPPAVESPSPVQPLPPLASAESPSPSEPQRDPFDWSEGSTFEPAPVAAPAVAAPATALPRGSMGAANVPSKRGLSDRVLQATFTFARSISVLVIFVSVLIVIGGVAMGAYALLPGPSGERGRLDQPTMNQFEETCRQAAQQTQSSSQSQSSRRSGSNALLAADECAEYRERLQTVIARLEVNPAAIDTLCNKVASLPKPYKLPFMDGIDQLSQSWASMPTKPSNCSGADAANWFMREFNDRIASEDARIMREAQEAAERRELLSPALNGIAAAIACLLVFLILPLLIQIERNTRLPQAA